MRQDVKPSKFSGASSSCKRRSRRELLMAAAFGISTLMQAAVQSPADAMVGGMKIGEDEMLAKGLVGLTYRDPQKERSYYCSGTLLDAKQGLVLTAKHCTGGEGRTPPVRYVVFSPNMFSKDAERRDVIETRTPKDASSDLAILRFKGPVPPGYRPVNLATGLKPFESVPAQTPVTAYGYGSQERDASETYETPLGTLKKLQAVLLADVDDSRPIFTTKPTKREEGQCDGDSGGPLVATLETGPVQVGVLSKISVADCAGATEEYVNVKRNAEWIEETVKDIERSSSN